MSYNVRNPKMEALLRELAKKLDNQIPEGWGFTLFLFEFDPGDSLFYISNAERPNMIKAVKEWLARQIQ